MNTRTILFALFILAFAGSALAAESDPPAPAQEAPAKATSQAAPAPKDRKAAVNKKRPSFRECDKDGDNALDLDEYLACYPKGKNRFEAMDADKDGKLTKEETTAHHKAAQTERRRAHFAACDANGDGVLNFEEFDQCNARKRHAAPPKRERAPRGDAT